jgi:hypothetical protein
MVCHQKEHIIIFLFQGNNLFLGFEGRMKVILCPQKIMTLQAYVIKRVLKDLYLEI